MIKVFLVEDEVLMRNGIKNNIPWEKEGFEFAGEASDGELAYPLIKEKKPDIVITDIRMPFMDGLELSRLIRKELPFIKIIILSGYNEFDYAKTAIGLGVTEYLLKPISSAKLLDAVKRVAVMVEEEQEHQKMMEQYHQDMSEIVLIEKHRLWNSLVSNQIAPVELMEKGQSLSMDFSASAYIVFLFKVFQGDNTCFQKLVEVSDWIDAISETWDQVLTFDRSPDGWAFLIKAHSDENAREVLGNVCRQLENQMVSYPEVFYFGGTGSVVHRISEISRSNIDAARAFTGRFFQKENQILDYTCAGGVKNSSSQRIDVSQLRSKKMEYELIDRFLKGGTIDEINSFLDEYFQGISEENIRSLIYRQYLIMNFYFSVSDFLGNMEKNISDLPDEFRDINQIVETGSAKIKNFDQLKGFVQRLFTETLKVRDNQSQKKYNALLEQAKVYIRENYKNEDMSLNTVATQVGISPSYFSAIFSGETGQTFVEYLTSVRLEKAKEMLMCSNMRTSEIGYQVGYKEPHYFSYIFKKTVGCTPKEFRNRGLQ